MRPIGQSGGVVDIDRQYVGFARFQNNISFGRWVVAIGRFGWQWPRDTYVPGVAFDDPGGGLSGIDDSAVDARSIPIEKSKFDPADYYSGSMRRVEFSPDKPRLVYGHHCQHESENEDKERGNGSNCAAVSVQPAKKFSHTVEFWGELFVLLPIFLSPIPIGLALVPFFWKD
jgi:hypothetical protein